MNDLLAARYQMAISLAFHIVYASIGMTLPFFMFVAHLKWIRTGKEVYLQLTRAWSRGIAIFFAIGAVSGTVLSFELGLLWPEFMKHAGPIIGMPFSWEGAAFFVEAIALGLFLYGWKMLNKWVHLTSGLLIGISGVASGFFVIAANGWMNSPEGFDWINGRAINIDPVDAMFNAAWISQSTHMVFAAFAATGFGVAGLHAILLLKNRTSELHKSAVKIALTFGVVASLIMPISGDFAAKNVAKRQPEKLAAMESLFETQAHAPLLIGGIPDVEEQEVRMAIEIPGFLSFLAFGKTNAEVKGLDQFPPDEWPPVLLTHISFQLMVLFGLIMAAISILFIAFSWRWKNTLIASWWLRLLGFSMPLGFLAIETGWMVTELGRQPWIIYRIMRTEEALTQMPGIVFPLVLISLVYLILSLLSVYLMRRQIRYVHENLTNS
ncbi:MAG: cytochrome ubiquinol oxidase subunit I [Bacteroidales bacterium]|nr:cytochrome ubiquinol oxidase subunit I [Bacteroidales bacterium]